MTCAELWGPYHVRYRHRIRHGSSCRLLVEADIARLKADLAPLEACEVRVGECISDGDWHDITPAAISLQRRTISTLESMLNVLHG